MQYVEHHREMANDQELPDEGGSTRRARPYTAQDPHLRGQQPARSAVRRPRPPPEGEQASRPAPYIQVKSRWSRISLYAFWAFDVQSGVFGHWVDCMIAIYVEKCWQSVLFFFQLACWLSRAVTRCDTMWLMWHRDDWCRNLALPRSVCARLKLVVVDDCVRRSGFWNSDRIGINFL